MKVPAVVLLMLLSVGFAFISCLEINNQYSKLPPGPWRAVLKLDPERARVASVPRETRVRDRMDFDEVTEGDLPFNFTVQYPAADSMEIIIQNAAERIVLREINFARDYATNKDTVTIPFPPYDSYFSVIFEGNVMEGKWVVPSRGNYEIDFVAHHGKNHRFTTLRKEPIVNLTGKWEVYFGLENEVPDPAIGEFIQEGNLLTGSFITETGDYRFLEGTVQGNKMYLSCFDGAHMFLFEAIIREDGSLSGIFRSGIHFMTSWSGKRNSEFRLKNADSITYLVDRSQPLTFSFPDETGTLTSLSDPRFAGKPKVIQILGTWCPNCLDETKFILEYLRSNDPDLVVIGLAFERHVGDLALDAIRQYRSKLKIPYPILYAGKADKEEASRQMPMLNQITSFPTLLFLDPNNQVVRIYTGFTGPATSAYPRFKADFDATIKQLVAQ